MAGPFVGLQLEQFEQTDLLVRGCGELESVPLVAEHDARRVHLEQLDAALGQQVEQVDHVVVVDQGVREVDERRGEAFGVHGAHLRRVRLGRGFTRRRAESGA